MEIKEGGTTGESSKDKIFWEEETDYTETRNEREMINGRDKKRLKQSLSQRTF